MKLGITGASGLLGTHTRALLLGTRGAHEVALATRETFASASSLDGFVADLDGILHFAGMNRGEDSEVIATNIDLAERLVVSLRNTGSRPSIAYANSTHVDRGSAYGNGKRRAGEILEEWGREKGARVGNFVLPHIFGEFGKPFYNSVVSTFCFQLATGDAPKIDHDGQVELLHASNVARHFIDWLESADQLGLMRLQGEPMAVSTLLMRLQRMMHRYQADGVIPTLEDPIDRDLFNTLRSYLFPILYPRALPLQVDARGSLFEAIKTDQRGQVFLSTTLPGITRGNHWHMHKVERFLVLSGSAAICIRRLFSDEVVTFQVNGELPAYVDIPTMHAHSITNTGDGVLQTLFWANEIFDPARSDTYPEAVSP